MLMGFFIKKKEFGIMIATVDKIIIYLVLNDFKKDEIIIARIKNLDIFDHIIMSHLDYKESLKVFEKHFEFLQLVAEMIYSDCNIRFDTGIYKHHNNYCEYNCDCCDSDDLDEKEDIIKIYRNKKITIKHIIKLFHKIQKQFKKLKKLRCFKPCYFYQSIEYDSETETYYIVWDIEP